jgi:tryptophan synthase alpha chain
VGFGVKDAASAGAIAREADGVVVGTALVEALRATLVDGKPGQNTVKAVTGLVGNLAAGVRGARARAAE